MSHKYEHSDEYVKKILNEYEIAYDDACWEKLKSDLPKRVVKKNIFDSSANAIKKISISQKKIIAIGILSLLLLVFCSYFIFSSNPAKNTVPVTETPVKIKQVEAAPVQKNNLPATTEKQIPPTTKITAKLPVNIAPVKQPIIQQQVVVKNKFPVQKSQPIINKAKKDSTKITAVPVEKSVADNDFDFVKSVEKNKVTEALALPDTLGSAKKQRKNSPENTSASKDSLH